VPGLTPGIGAGEESEGQVGLEAPAFDSRIEMFEARGRQVKVQFAAFV